MRSGVRFEEDPEIIRSKNSGSSKSLFKASSLNGRGLEKIVEGREPHQVMPERRRPEKAEARS